MPLGETIVVWSSILLIALYVRLTGATWFRVALTVLGYYGLIVVFLLLVPSAAFQLHTQAPAISVNEAVGMLLLLAVS